MLNLSGSKITDAGMRHLEGLNELRHFGAGKLAYPHHQSLFSFGICSEVLVAERLESM